MRRLWTTAWRRTETARVRPSEASSGCGEAPVLPAVSISRFWMLIKATAFRAGAESRTLGCVHHAHPCGMRVRRWIRIIDPTDEPDCLFPGPQPSRLQGGQHAAFDADVAGFRGIWQKNDPWTGLALLDPSTGAEWGGCRQGDQGNPDVRGRRSSAVTDTRNHGEPCARLNGAD